MPSCFGKKGKKKLSKSQIKEEWDSVHKKIPCIYKGLYSINVQLKAITQHKTTFSNPNHQEAIITHDFDAFYEQISNILETISKLENVYNVEKPDFDVKLF